MTRFASALLAVVGALPGACATAPPAPGLIDLLDRPAERQLFDAIRAYDEGQFSNAEKALRLTLASALGTCRPLDSAKGRMYSQY